MMWLESQVSVKKLLLPSPRGWWI